MEASLYVTEPGCTVRRRGGSLVVTRDVDADGAGPAPERREVLIEVEPHRLEVLGLIGRGANVSSGALDLCLREGVAVAWLSRSGRIRGRLVPAQPRSGDLRLSQYAAVESPEVRGALAGEIVSAKLAGAAEVLEDLQRNRPGQAALGEAIAAVRDAMEEAAGETDPERLLGLEGLGARAYFAGFGHGLRVDLGFGGRRRRPPPDPVNALLSFGYTLLVQRVAGRVEARGLDVALGFLHRPRPGRPSLALDLVEELRHPVVDRLVMRLVNLRMLDRDDFEPDPRRPGGVRLEKPALRRFLKEWEAHLRRPLREVGTAERLTVDRLVVRQIDRLARHLRGSEPYRGFRFGS